MTEPRDRFECTECPFTTDDMADAIEHVYAEHVDVMDWITDRHNEEPPGWRA